MASNDTLEKVIQYLNEHDCGVPSSVIAEKFLALKGGNELVNGKLVEAVLRKSPTISLRDGLWYAEQFSSPLLNTEPFLICVPLLSNDKRSILQIALLKMCGDEREQLLSFRITGTDDLLMTKDEQVYESISDGFHTLYKLFSSGRVLFSSHYEQRLLLKFLLDAGYSLPDSTLLLSHIFKMADLPMTGAREGVISVAKNLFSIEKDPVTAVEIAELVGDTVQFLFEKMQDNGLVTIEQFGEKEVSETLSAKWDRAQFSLADIQNLEDRPGVYGFKNESDEYIYVGKGANVRARLQTYFRISEESPQKLLQLRQESVTFTSHYCGNELEALLLESRLINKYQPKLNTQIEVHDQNGNYQNIPVGIYLLPALQEDRCYTLWCGEDGSIAAKTFPRNIETSSVVSELNSYFYQKRESIVSTETRIAQRWLRPRIDFIDRIDTNSAENCEQLSQLFSDVLSSTSYDGTIYR